jgi:hypothetical protein
MTPQPHKKSHKKDMSELEKFSLGYELDVSWSQAKQTVQHRPIK